LRESIACIVAARTARSIIGISMRRSIAIYGRVAATLSIALVAGCKQPEAPAAGAASAAPIRHEGGRLIVDAASPVRKALEVAAVEVGAVERPIGTAGVVEADPGKWVKIVPPVSGRIVHLSKHLGDTVRRGDALFVLDSPELAQAVSDAAKADATLALSQRSLEREQALMQAEIAARKDLEQSQGDFALAASESRRAHARLVQLDVQPGDGSGRQYTLRAPIDGHVIDLTAAEGGFWNDTNAPIMTVADLSSVWIAASIPEKDLSAVAVGQDAAIELNAYPGEPVHGTVGYVGEVLDADTRTVKARIAVANPNGRLRPGMFARVVFHAQAHPAPLVPAAALVQAGFDTQVYVERSAGVFEARTVTLGARVGGAVEVTSGLAGGERIVVKNGVLLND